MAEGLFGLPPPDFWGARFAGICAGRDAGFAAGFGFGIEAGFDAGFA